jgi:hypothetical protein
MKNILLPKNEFANSLHRKGYTDAVLYNQRTYTRLNIFGVHSCLCEHIYLTTSLVPYFPWLPRHVLSFSVLRSLSTLRNLTTIFFGLPPGPTPADLTLYCKTVDNDWGSDSSPAFPIPWFSLASQVQSRESSITVSKNKGVPRVGIGC